jgi:threonine/homoserine/homoserine lactone efflux protein
MEITLLIVTAWVIGFITAIPLGATQIEIAKRALRGHMRQAWMIAAGSAASDIMYGLIAMFGIAPFLRNNRVMTAFWVVSWALLLALGVYTLLHQSKHINLRQPEKIRGSKRLALLLGFSLAVTNSPIMLWWLLYAEFIKKLGILQAFTAKTSVIFVVSGGAGIASYLVLLSFILRRVGKFMSKKTEAAINLSLGVLLLLLSFYPLVKLVQLFR